MRLIYEFVRKKTIFIVLKNIVLFLGGSCDMY